MLRRVPTLFVFLCCALVLAAQNPPSQKSPPSDFPAVVDGASFQRPGPPPANASAKDLEQTGDKLRENRYMADAIDYYEAAAKRGGNESQLYNKMGIASLDPDHFSRAQKYFEHAIKLDKDFAEAYNNLGTVWYSRAAPRQPNQAVHEHDVKRAIRYYEQAIALRDDSASFHSNLGLALFALKKYEEAYNEYQKAVQLDPDIFTRRSRVGVNALLSGPADRARYNFVLARLYAHQGSFDQALQCLRKAMEDGYPRISEVYTDANFEALRKDPRFGELMASKPTAIPQ